MFRKLLERNRPDRMKIPFSAFVVGTLGASAATGWLCFSIIKRNNNADFAQQDGGVSSSPPPTLEEARLQAMIENAQTSSWRENLDNAMQAQARFVLPNQQHSPTQFVEKLERRSHEILNERRQQYEQQQELQAKRTDRFWK